MKISEDKGMALKIMKYIFKMAKNQKKNRLH